MSEQVQIKTMKQPTEYGTWIMQEQVCSIGYYLENDLINYFYDNLNDDDNLMVLSYSWNGEFDGNLIRPVFQVYIKQYELEITFKKTFLSWLISIKSAQPLNFDTMGLIDINEKFSPDFIAEHPEFAGFPADKIFGNYAENHSQFTFSSLVLDYEVYTFFFLLKNYLNEK